MYTSAAHRLRVTLLRAADAVTERTTAFAEPFGLTQQQFNALRVLRGRKRQEEAAAEAGEDLGSFSTSDLRARLITRASDTPRLIDRLIQKGLVHKKPCDHDARRVHLTITEAGLALLRQLDAESARLDTETVPISDTEAARLADSLEALLIKLETAQEFSST
ncbi:MAG: winged helix DNA-binding protein [Bacteroidota bacterium]